MICISIHVSEFVPASQAEPFDFGWCAIYDSERGGEGDASHDSPRTGSLVMHSNLVMHLSPTETLMAVEKYAGVKTIASAFSILKSIQGVLVF